MGDGVKWMDSRWAEEYYGYVVLVTLVCGAIGPLSKVSKDSFWKSTDLNTVFLLFPDSNICIGVLNEVKVKQSSKCSCKDRMC